MDDILIRRAREGDEAVLARIQTESWRSAFSGILDGETLLRYSDAARSEKMYGRLLRENVGRGYILAFGGRAHCIAWWDAARDDDLRAAGGTAEIICIHSLPDNRRKGYGGAMMDRVLSDIKAEGYIAAALWVFRENFGARAFYEAKGFSADDSVRKALGADEMRYVKAL